MRVFLFAGWLVVLSAAIPAQQTPQFEVASIRATDPGTVGNTVGLRVTCSQVRYGGLSLKDYIVVAYDMSPQQVFAPNRRHRNGSRLRPRCHRIDLTGTTDRFDFMMELVPRDASFVSIRAAVTNGFPVAPDALHFLEGAPSNVLGPYIAETGLVLEERRAPLEVIVMESASKEPTLN